MLRILRNKPKVSLMQQIRFLLRDSFPVDGYDPVNYTLNDQPIQAGSHEDKYLLNFWTILWGFFGLPGRFRSDTSFWFSLMLKNIFGIREDMSWLAKGFMFSIGLFTTLPFNLLLIIGKSFFNSLRLVTEIPLGLIVISLDRALGFFEGEPEEARKHVDRKSLFWAVLFLIWTPCALIYFMLYAASHPVDSIRGAFKLAHKYFKSSAWVANIVGLVLTVLIVSAALSIYAAIAAAFFYLMPILLPLILPQVGPAIIAAASELLSTYVLAYILVPLEAIGATMLLELAGYAVAASLTAVGVIIGCDLFEWGREKFGNWWYRKSFQGGVGYQQTPIVEEGANRGDADQQKVTNNWDNKDSRLSVIQAGNDGLGILESAFAQDTRTSKQKITFGQIYANRQTVAGCATKLSEVTQLQADAIPLRLPNVSISNIPVTTFNGFKAKKAGFYKQVCTKLGLR